MIYYFTGTGNSQAAAGFFSSRMGEDMKSMAEAIKKKEFTCEIGENETLGLVFPVYYWGLPTVVVHFLSHLKLTGKRPYVWAVITCGSGTGAADRQLKAVGKKAGIPIDAVFSLVMPDNFIPMFPVPGDQGIREILAKADVRMEEILGELRKRGSGEESKAKDLMLSASMQTLYRNGRKTSRFSVDDTCIGCGQCASFCPVGAIGMADGRPVWKKDRCAFCMGCINRCPKAAIQYGRSTRKNGRYVYPRG